MPIVLLYMVEKLLCKSQCEIDLIDLMWYADADNDSPHIDIADMKYWYFDVLILLIWYMTYRYIDIAEMIYDMIYWNIDIADMIFYINV